MRIADRTTTHRIAIGCLMPDISGTYEAIQKDQIRDLADRFDIELRAIVELDITGSESRILNAVRQTGASTVIVPEFRHLQPASTLSAVQKVARVVTVAGERALPHGVYEHCSPRTELATA